MRPAALAAAVLAGCAAGAAAQTASGGGRYQTASGGGRYQTASGGGRYQTASGGGRSCVDVRIGDEQYYDCLNRQLDAAVTGRRVPSLQAPLDAGSPPVALGEYNEAAIRERMGTSYGKSLVPQRPPAPVFTNPLIRR